MLPQGYGGIEALYVGRPPGTAEGTARGDTCHSTLSFSETDVDYRSFGPTRDLHAHNNLAVIAVVF